MTNPTQKPEGGGVTQNQRLGLSLLETRQGEEGNQKRKVKIIPTGTLSSYNISIKMGKSKEAT